MEIENIPLPEELDEDESLYRRRRKAVPVRRTRFSSLLRALRWLLTGLFFVLLPMSYTAYRMAMFASTSSLFQLDPEEDVVVEGNHHISRQEIIDALGLPPAGNRLGIEVNMFQLSLENKRRQVESLPWVLSATLCRAYPRRLVVRIAERTPIAFANVGGHVELVDAEGTFLEKPEKASFDFPILSGLESAGTVAERRSRLALYQEFGQKLAGELSKSGWLVSEVNLSDADDLKALLIQGQETILVHFGRRDFPERFHSFLTLLPEVRKTNSKIESVDLRYRNQIVVNPQRAVTSNK